MNTDDETELLNFFHFGKKDKIKVYAEFSEFEEYNKSIFFLILLSVYKIKSDKIIYFLEVLKKRYYEKYPEEDKCIVCFQENVFLHSFDCQHRILCKKCLDKNISICPLCRHKSNYSSMDFIDTCVQILEKYELSSLEYIPIWLLESKKLMNRIFNSNMNIYFYSKKVYLNEKENEDNRYKIKSFFLFLPEFMYKRIIPNNYWKSVLFCIKAINVNIMNANKIPSCNFPILYSCSYEINLKKNTFIKNKISNRCYNNLHFCLLLIDHDIINTVEIVKKIENKDTLVKVLNYI